MPTAQAPGEFTNEELLALLRDASVSIQAIVDEMEDAGAHPLPAQELQVARELLQDFAPDKHEGFSRLNPDLRELLLTEAVNALACDFVAALSGSDDRSVAKLGKKAIHVLRTRGIIVERRKATADPGTPPPAQQEEFPTWMTMPNGLGVRHVYFPFASRGLVEVAIVRLSDVDGVLDASVHLLTRKDFRRLQEQLVSASLPAAEVPHDYARWLVMSALDLNARARRAVPSSFNDVAFLIGGGAEKRPSPGRDIAPGDDENMLVSRGGELFLTPHFRDWGPGDRELEEIENRRWRIQESRLYIDETQRTEAIRETMEEAVRSWFTEENRILIAQRLFDAGAILLERNERELAVLAAASARALDSDRDIMAIPFAVGFIDLEQRGWNLEQRPSAVDIAARQESQPDLILPR